MNPNHLPGLFEKAAGWPLPGSLKILLNFCFSWRPADLKKRRAPVFIGLFELAEGLVSLPEVVLTSMKLLLNFCFCS